MSALERVDGAWLGESLRNQNDFAVDAVEVFAELESTNRYLLDNAPDRPSTLQVCIAEFQTRGRGRRGREWYAPRHAGLCLSAGWIFARSPPDPATIALAAGVVARRVLESVCCVTVSLKWPNDLIWGRRKLGGILVELASPARQRCHVVVGIGINVALPVETLATISDWPGGAVDLRTALRGEVPDRTALAASLCVGLGNLFVDYERAGFDEYRDAWRRADHLVDAAVVVQRGEMQQLRGTARGIDDDGALLVTDASGEVHRVISGDVSVRLS